MAELLEDFFYRDLAGDEIAIDTAGKVATVLVMHAQDWVAAVDFAEASIRLASIEGVDKHRNERFRSFYYSWIAERTAREVTATCSARVFAEVHPE